MTKTTLKSSNLVLELAVLKHLQTLLISTGNRFKCPSVDQRQAGREVSAAAEHKVNKRFSLMVALL